MKTLLASAALAAALYAPASADEAASTANALLFMQAADAITTRDLLAKPGTFERDPLARPFVRSDLGAAASAVLVNVAVRFLFHRQPAVARTFAHLEGLAVANNLHLIDAAGSIGKP